MQEILCQELDWSGVREDRREPARKRRNAESIKDDGTAKSAQDWHEATVTEMAVFTTLPTSWPGSDQEDEGSTLFEQVDTVYDGPLGPAEIADHCLGGWLKRFLAAVRATEEILQPDHL